MAVEPFKVEEGREVADVGSDNPVPDRHADERQRPRSAGAAPRHLGGVIASQHVLHEERHISSGIRLAHDEQLVVVILRKLFKEILQEGIVVLSAGEVGALVAAVGPVAAAEVGAGGVAPALAEADGRREVDEEHVGHR